MNIKRLRNIIESKGGDTVVLSELISNISVLSVVLFVVGLILIAIEMHLPGFGIFGVLGIIVLVIDIFITAETFVQGMIMTAAFFVIIAVVLAILISFASKGRLLPKGLTLKESTSAELGFSGTEDMKYLIGKTGKAVTVLRPVGSVDLDGVKLDVVTRGEYIPKDTVVEVIEVEGNRIVVREREKAQLKAENT